MVGGGVLGNIGQGFLADVEQGGGVAVGKTT